MSRLPHRRELLKMSLVAVSALPGACYQEGSDDSPLSEAESARYFPQSVASGDPRPDGVVLWVRAEDSGRPGENLTLSLVVATDPELHERVTLKDSDRLTVQAASDYCLRVQLSGLEAGKTYYYRFRYLSGAGFAETRVGRTRTAPAPDSDEIVRLGVVCCQDYAGKYFHVHRQLAEEDVDFVLHLGDYVYESVGDPAFQSPTAEREVKFSAPDEALQVGSGEQGFLAAQSLSNYRDLYKLYRRDPDLQALHERHPIIAIWDDHEFSDDCHQDVATYTDGRSDEASPDRRAAAEQAWFEHMPVDYDTAPAVALDSSAAFPGDFSIYRSFVFGRHLELVVTDLRRYRPDHLVPEDAAPGVVFSDQQQLSKLLGELPADAVPYVDVDSYADGSYRQALRDGAGELGITPEKIAGNLSAVWINQALEALAAADGPAPIDLADPALERGYAYHCLLKTSEFSRMGSRYVLALGPFQALAKQGFAESEGASERLMGEAQRAWFLDKLEGSTRTFKLWASEVAFMSRRIDLQGVSAAPPELQQRIQISAEDWDGFPNERRELLSRLGKLSGMVVLSGDLHCFFAGTPCLEDDPETRVIELTTGSVSSTTWLDGIEGILGADGSIPMDVKTLVQNIGALLADPGHKPNPHLAYQELRRHGYSLLEVSGDQLSFEVHTIAGEHVATPAAELPGELAELFESERFRTQAGSKDLEQQFGDEYLTWDMAEMVFK